MSKGKVIDGKFHHEGRVYNIERYRPASQDELIFITPRTLRFDGFHKEYNIPYYTPFLVQWSLCHIVSFRNSNSDTGSTHLRHDEYLIIGDEIENRVKIGEDVIVKKFLGITFYSKVTDRYSMVGAGK